MPPLPRDLPLPSGFSYKKCILPHNTNVQRVDSSCFQQQQQQKSNKIGQCMKNVELRFSHRKNPTTGKLLTSNDCNLCRLLQNKSRANLFTETAKKRCCTKCKICKEHKTLNLLGKLECYSL